MINIEGKIRKACEAYSLIDDGDRIAVGVSGGKDSVALLYALHSLSSYYNKKFFLTALIIDPQFDGIMTDYTPIMSICDELGIEIKVNRSNLGEVIFKIRKEKNPCSLCARMRRGMLHDMTIDAGCSKIALGHHLDDAVETLFLNLFHQGRLESFKSKTYLSRKDITMIRPLIFCRESEVREYVKQLCLPVVKSCCPKDGNSERETVKRFLEEKEKEYPGFCEKAFYAMQRGNISDLGLM